MAPDPYRYFRLEARELLDQCAKTMLELEKDGASGPPVQQMLRLAHTLKGAARVVKQAEIADHAHAVEELLGPFRHDGQRPTRPTIVEVLERIETIGALLPRLGVVEPAAERPAAAPAATPAPASAVPVDDMLRSVRADIGEMDAVLDGVAETQAQLGGLRRAARGLEQAQRLADVLAAQLVPERRPTGEAGRLFAIADELRRKLIGLERSFAGASERMDRELQQLRDATERLRLVPADSLFTRLERTALDTAAALGKRVTFGAEGGETRLEAPVMALAQGALIQLVRNAAAHGIELPEERKRVGKQEAGQITVSVARRGRRLVFACRDDGAGLDLEAIRRSALRRGLAVPSLDNERGLIDLLLKGGITTSKDVTELSGRGIGLDVVREAAERLGGEVAVKTGRGRGTVFELIVPPSLSALDALIVAAGDDIAAIPLEAVRATRRAEAGDMVPTSPGLAIVHDKQAVAFVSLSTILKSGPQPTRQAWSVVILAGGAALAALGVDRLLGTARIVVRPMPDHVAVSPAVAGLMLDAQGDPQLVLDADGIVAAAQQGMAGLAPPVTERVPVLVIDDSLTTRMLEQSILESAGYAVDTALSAEEGLELARRNRYALILVDVEMPGMDGFTFVEKIRADPQLRRIPAILVTSRAAPEDLERGRTAGAQGYVIKSEFDQSALLAMIEPLVR
jgi:two-component system, chemotaxis family, sensor kinase CheA